MLVQTKFFGEVEIDDDKIVNFKDGLLGLDQYKSFTIIYDSESEDNLISWLQSTVEKDIVLPILNPFLIEPDYNPIVEDELLTPLGELREEDILMYTIATIREDRFTTNLKAPIIINTTTRKACQVIADNSEYEVRYDVKSAIKQLKQEKAGE